MDNTMCNLLLNDIRVQDGEEGLSKYDFDIEYTEELEQDQSVLDLIILTIKDLSEYIFNKVNFIVVWVISLILCYRFYKTEIPDMFRIE